MRFTVWKMKLLILIMFSIALPLSARTPRAPVHHEPLATPAPESPIRPPEAQPAYVKQLTQEQDDQLKLWITGIMKAGDEATAEVGALKMSLDDAKANLVSLQSNLVSTQTDLIGSQRAVIELDAQIMALTKYANEEHDGRVRAEAQVAKDKAQLASFSKLCRILAAIAASLAAFAVWQMLKPGGLIGTLLTASPMITFGAPVAVWMLVFGGTEIYLRYML